MNLHHPRLQPYRAARLADPPPLNVSSPNDPRLNRRAINRRWLTATVLMAGAACFLMLGALDVAFHGKWHFRAAVAVFARSTVAEIDESLDGRGDRLDPLKTTVQIAPSQVHLGELSVPSLGAKPQHRLQAHLGPGETVAVVSAVARRAEPSDDADPVQLAGDPMPPEIRYGTSVRRRRAVHPATLAALGYADGEDTLARAEAINMTVVPEALNRQDMVEKIIMAKPKDTLPLILTSFGASNDDAQAITARMPGWADGKPGLFAGGEMVTVVQPDTAGDKASVRPSRVIVQRPGNDPVAVALADNGSYDEMSAPPTASTDMPKPPAGAGAVPATGPSISVRDNLYALAQANNMDRSVVDQAVRLAGRDIDLDGPASPDDNVDILYALDDDGQQELTFAGLTVAGETHRYYRFTSPDDRSTDYYDEDGHSQTVMLLRKPVANGRLGDGFGWRIHPVLHDRRFHQGVDYAAPFGSPVAAAGSGVIEKIDQESGYGKYIRVLHDQGYETTYAHVSGFPRNMRVGTRVRQGETIAYIGSTGLSTGPHLYYEVRINGRNVDPLRIKLEAGRVLGGGALVAFKQQREKLEAALTQ
ncbi:M23 family metallopeptidase [Labrys miyagiensis]|uniref:M23 family metallopeptidase n=1 Tax=Labrys miyagiensis TaxID=346912 RepID=UPI0024E0F510|nr:M23 family metallopeptidase [Labrys miyagiensis]